MQFSYTIVGGPNLTYTVVEGWNLRDIIVGGPYWTSSVSEGCNLLHRIVGGPNGLPQYVMDAIYLIK